MDHYSISHDTSISHSMHSEAWEGGEIGGACLRRSSHMTELGLWDYPLMDPETAQAGGAYLPLGPWAKGATICSLVGRAWPDITFL
jgi:hypothetical protein